MKKGLPNWPDAIVVVRIVVVDVPGVVHIERIVRIGRVRIRRFTDTYPICHKGYIDNNIFRTYYQYFQMNQ